MRKPSVKTKSGAMKSLPKAKERRLAKREVYKSPLGLNVQILEGTFKVIKPNLEALVKQFYVEFFRRYPRMESLFGNIELEVQERKLISAIQQILANLRNPKALVGALRRLGVKHEVYGVKPENYAAFASTLLEVLKEFVGDMWTPKVHDAWSGAIETIAATMLTAYGSSRKKLARKKAPNGQVEDRAGILTNSNALLEILEGIPHCSLVIDHDDKIVFLNKLARESFKALHKEIRRLLPGFKLAGLMGSSIHKYFSGTSIIKSIFRGLRAHSSKRAEITLGNYRFKYQLRKLVDQKGTRLGYVIYWTEQ